MSAEPMRWKDRVIVAENELVVAAIILASVIDKRYAPETDWQRLILALHRLRALVATP